MNKGSLRVLVTLVAVYTACVQAQILEFLFDNPTTNPGYTQNWMSESCQQDFFPIMAGGTGNETVRCVHHDIKKTNFTIIAGTSVSTDFSHNASSFGTNSTGFAYAVDYRGNWRWGKYFVNATTKITNITACRIDNNNNLAVAGYSN